MQDAADKVPRKKLQLVGVTAMFIAAKYEEMYAPEIGNKNFIHQFLDRVVLELNTSKSSI